MSIPHIDPSVKYVGVSKLRELNASRLREVGETDETFVIQENDSPLAVLLSYEKFLIMQDKMKAVVNTLELFAEKPELEGLVAALQAFASGDRGSSLSEVKARLRRKYGSTEKASA